MTSEALEVATVFTLFNVTAIEPRESKVDLCFKVSLYWRVAELVNRSEGEVIEAEELERHGGGIDFEINNAVSLDEDREPAVVWDSSEGLLRQAIRYRGTVFQQLDVRGMPYDKHTVWIQGGPVFSRKNRLIFRSGRRGHLLDTPPLVFSDSLGAVEHCIPGWDLVSLDVSSSVAEQGNPSVSSSWQSEKFSRISVAFGIERRSEYYIVRIVLILFAQTLISLTAFALPVEDLPSRSTLSVTMLLSAVAFLSSVSEELPRGGGLTRLDAFILVALGVMFCQCLGVTGLYVLDNTTELHGKHDQPACAPTKSRWRSQMPAPIEEAVPTELVNQLDMGLLLLLSVVLLAGLLAILAPPFYVHNEFPGGLYRSGQTRGIGRQNSKPG